MRIDQLRTRRAAARISQYDLAKAIGKSQFYVSGAERGIFHPSKAMLAKMEIAIRRLAERRKAIDHASSAIAATFPKIKDVCADL
jgi:predicted transcriptional regulator